MAAAQRRVLLARAGLWLCALSMRDVVETMRPLPVVAVASALPFLRGLAIVRGAPLPVLVLRGMLGAPEGAVGARFVILRAGPRRLALEVDEVVGMPDLDVSGLEQASPLLTGMQTDYVERIGALDGELLVTLASARLIREEIWRSLAEQGVR